MCASSKMMEHAAFLRKFYSPFVNLSPGIAGSEDCENLLAQLKTMRMIAEKYLARNFLSIQLALGQEDLDNVYRRPDAENAADGLTKEKSDLAPLLRLLRAGSFYPGTLRQQRGRTATRSASGA